MFRYIVLSLDTLVRLLRARRSLRLENLALRQQLVVLKRRHPRPRISLVDKLFWVVVSRFCSVWKQSLIVVTPATVVRWQRAGFHVYWRLISSARTQVGRRPTSQEVRGLIFRMVVENPTWGAPRINGELLMLGFDLSERTISRWMKRAPRDPEPAKRWLALLRNHREAIAAMDFFAAPTITFGVLYCFFVISHERLSGVNYFFFGGSSTSASPSTPRAVGLSSSYGNISIRIDVKISHLRPGREIRVGGPRGHSIPEDGPRADLLRKPLAKWCGGALSRKLPTRLVGTCCRRE